MKKVTMTIKQFMQVQRGELTYKDLEPKTSLFDPVILAIPFVLPSMMDVYNSSDLVMRGIDHYHNINLVCEYVQTFAPKIRI